MIPRFVRILHEFYTLCNTVAVFFRRGREEIYKFPAACYTGCKASVDKGTHACGRGWNAACGVIVLDLRQQACVLCLAGNAPAVPASPSEFFAEDKRRLARQTRQVG